ncbi:unnamed protein product [Rhizophagus irregularis]|uniref:Uncharacterized protein n=1 Tax=Rhizophagus irregularis TaxID=588596 RepID=A0A916EE73_9GLOM|nr:unnamed protein product [Rhizophagus irregularis]CAB5384059.1 unnamed protein product [Rhizophagus irregularis]
MSKNYIGRDVLVSYLREQKKPSYRGFLALYQDEIITSPPFLDNWSRTDKIWAGRFLKASEEHEESNYEDMKKKVDSERSGDGLKNYWEKIIEERERRERNHTIKRKTEDKENVHAWTKRKISSPPEKASSSSSSIQVTLSSILSEEISISTVICNTLPNLIYLELRGKSNSSTESTEQRFPDEITNWVGFEQEVRAWKPEEDIKYPTPTFSKCRKVTCEKDIWTASDINIFDALTPLDQSILFLDGRTLKDTIGQPDFVVVNGNMLLLVAWECKPKWVLQVPQNEDIISLYYQEKKEREGTLVYSKDTSVFDPINQIYGYMCANSLRYGVLSTSVAYIINLASNDRYAPFLNKPIMITNDTNEGDEVDDESSDDTDFKYKGNLPPREQNVLTRSKCRQPL